MQTKSFDKIGQLLRHYRKQKKVSQQDLAKKCKISQTWLSQIEKERRLPTMRIVEELAAGLGISIVYTVIE